MHSKSYTPCRLDCETGYLVKSPCRECREHYRFPLCLRACDILDRIQSHLAHTVMTTRSYSSLESFTINLESRTRK